mmetsp:Transcript_6024/g.21274  ORF Transcript_6024/g.21274 Transcript_6024/m.21274 type:complete len:101 (-) Transcript_6024:1449-1751(-)
MARGTCPTYTVRPPIDPTVLDGGECHTRLSDRTRSSPHFQLRSSHDKERRWTWRATKARVWDPTDGATCPLVAQVDGKHTKREYLLQARGGGTTRPNMHK